MTDMRTIEKWIDTLAALWEISDGRTGTVRSFHVYDRAEIPEALSDTAYPCAISYPVSCLPEYSLGGPTLLVWKGKTEFHLVPGVQKIHIPYILPFFGRIVAAAAGSISLSGKASYFLLSQEEPILLATLQYGDETSHLGLIVNWVVKENITGNITVAA